MLYGAPDWLPAIEFDPEGRGAEGLAISVLAKGFADLCRDALGAGDDRGLVDRNLSLDVKFDNIDHFIGGGDQEVDDGRLLLPFRGELYVVDIDVEADRRVASDEVYKDSNTLSLKS